MLSKLITNEDVKLFTNKSFNVKKIMKQIASAFIVSMIMAYGFFLTITHYSIKSNHDTFEIFTSISHDCDNYSDVDSDTMKRIIESCKFKNKAALKDQDLQEKYKEVVDAYNIKKVYFTVDSFIDDTFENDLRNYKFLFYKSKKMREYDYAYRELKGEDTTERRQLNEKNKFNEDSMYSSIKVASEELRQAMKILVSPMLLFFNSITVFLVFKLTIAIASVFSIYRSKKAIEKGKPKKDKNGHIETSKEIVERIATNDNIFNIIIFSVLLPQLF